MRVPCVRLSIASLLLFAVPAAALHAQNDQCAGLLSTQAERVCNAAVDGTRAFHPLVGLLVSGGNPVLGTGSTLGGLGHFSVTMRANGTKLVLPDLEYDGSSSTVGADEEIFAPVPLVEAAVGVYQGMPSGFLSIDLLGSAQLLPTDQIENFSVDDDARRVGDVALGLGIGARVGLLRESGPLPGVSLSVMRRGLPELRYGDIASSGDYAYAVDLQATNVRVVASKNLAALDLAAGLGWDRYTGDARIEFRNPTTGLVEPPIELELTNSRTMAFLNAGLSVSVVRLVGEIGYQNGKDQDFTTEFEDFDPDGGRMFAGLGLRVGF